MICPSLFPAGCSRRIVSDSLNLFASRLLLGLVLFFGGESFLFAQTLEEELLRVPATELAEQARTQGDAQRGAIVFYQPHMACTKCHGLGDEKGTGLGPDLAALPKEVTDAHLVESVLTPSKAIRQGFGLVSVSTKEGKQIQGLLVERTAEKIVLREGDKNFQRATILASEIAEVKELATSMMPSGQVNQLGTRQQFFDLIRYLSEIRTGGAARALELRPSAALLSLTLPEYESRLNHAGLIERWNGDSLKRGEAIYQRVCANCHGTLDRVGSLPTSLRFGEGKFKNGSDPLSMYHTLTRGFGQMAPQTWMVPSQKYDVIHYVRETYLKKPNPTQYVTVDAAYTAKLPRGDTLGPEPSKIEIWSAMDYGPSLTHTYEIPGKPHHFAYKGIAMRLDAGPGGVSRGRHWMLLDTDTLRVAAGWSAEKGATTGKNFINWRGIQFNGEHNTHPQISGDVAFANFTGPGWGNPETGSLADTERVVGRDGLRYGPLPRSWARFRGLYYYGQQTIVSYTVGNATVLESPSLVANETQSAVFVRRLNIGARDRELILRVASEKNEQAEFAARDGSDVSSVVFPANAGKGPVLIASIHPRNLSAKWMVEGGQLCLRIPAGEAPLKFSVSLTREANSKLAAERGAIEVENAGTDLSLLTRGGPARWPQEMVTRMKRGGDEGAFAVDSLTAPDGNPWLAQTRFTGLDFFEDGRLAVCTWDGDVWLVQPKEEQGELHWRRIATGLFQPLGIKVAKGKIHVTCRDQLAVLNDLNGDGEIDFVQCLNNDHQVTDHFHEFAMGLQTDGAGNFYYAKSARHALKALVPHHGALLRISADGEKTDILAVGFRAANGVCLNPDGSFVVTDQEGHWNPKNRINWVTQDPSGKPKFYGNMYGYHDVTDASDDVMEKPLCWITNRFDRSPAELLWVNSERWGPLRGSLLNLSYGYGKVFVVPHEKVGGQVQGGMIELPIPTFPTGVMRGRFHPTDGQLYVCGMFAWAGNATQPGGLYRLRATGKPMNLPVGLHAKKGKLELTFTSPLDAASVNEGALQLQTWSLKRTANYGSNHFDEKTLKVESVALSADGKTVTVAASQLQPTWCMEIKYRFRSAAGENVTGAIDNTIHVLGD